MTVKCEVFEKKLVGLGSMQFLGRHECDCAVCIAYRDMMVTVQCAAFRNICDSDCAACAVQCAVCRDLSVGSRSYLTYYTR